MYSLTHLSFLIVKLVKSLWEILFTDDIKLASVIETAPVKLTQGHISGRIKWIRVGEITKLLPCLLGGWKAHSILGDLHKAVSIPLQISLRVD